VESRPDRGPAKSRATHRRTFGNREGGVKAQGGDMIDLLTIEEVAERLRVSVLTARWLRQEGRFAPAIKVGRRLVWDARDVAAWLESHREPTEVA
jgi:excisionase family DNA binding protein